MQVGVAGGASGPTMVTHGLDAAPPTLSRGVVPRRRIAVPSPLRASPLLRHLRRGHASPGAGPPRGHRAPRPRGDEPSTSRSGSATADRVAHGPATVARARSSWPGWPRCWVRLWRQGQALRPDVVVVRLPRALRRAPGPAGGSRDSTIVLDHMVSLGDTVRDRGLGDASLTARAARPRRPGRPPRRRRGGRGHPRAGRQPPDGPEARSSWCRWPPRRPGSRPPPRPTRAADEPVRIVFFGLYTPLPGRARPSGRALAAAPGDRPCEVTMVGTGQDLEETRALRGRRRPRPLDRLGRRGALPDAGRRPPPLPRHLRRPAPKAQRVVPNKVLQGAAAGCAIVTSDTAVQREALGDGAVLRPAGAPSDAGRRARPRSSTDRALLADQRAPSSGDARRRGSPRRPRSARCSRSSTDLSRVCKGAAREPPAAEPERVAAVGADPAGARAAAAPVRPGAGDGPGRGGQPASRRAAATSASSRTTARACVAEGRLSPAAHRPRRPRCTPRRPSASTSCAPSRSSSTSRTTGTRCDAWAERSSRAAACCSRCPAHQHRFAAGRRAGRATSAGTAATTWRPVLRRGRPRPRSDRRRGVPVRPRPGVGPQPDGGAAAARAATRPTSTADRTAWSGRTFQPPGVGGLA